jgi:hypothetical protein
MKLLLADLEKKYKGLRHRIFGALCRGEVDGFHPMEKALRVYRDEEEK